MSPRAFPEGSGARGMPQAILSGRLKGMTEKEETMSRVSIFLSCALACAARASRPLDAAAQQAAPELPSLSFQTAAAEAAASGDVVLKPLAAPKLRLTNDELARLLALATAAFRKEDGRLKQGLLFRRALIPSGSYLQDGGLALTWIDMEMLGWDWSGRLRVLADGRIAKVDLFGNSPIESARSQAFIRRELAFWLAAEP
ncbi:MAG: hypothetical protein HY554_09655 [Elusimicrobia bacterium]|nr:hypothetical protein [Elusimicrobiota bacterium]